MSESAMYLGGLAVFVLAVLAVDARLRARLRKPKYPKNIVRAKFKDAEMSFDPPVNMYQAISRLTLRK